jgi:hypothetical protein
MDVLYNLPIPHPRHSPTKYEIASSKRLIKGLDQKIEGVKSEIDKLQARLQSLQRDRENHASYISPLRRLPPEIWNFIVYECLEQSVDILVIIQICGTIRDIIVETPTFWNKIHLVPPCPYSYDGWVSLSQI